MTTIYTTIMNLLAKGEKVFRVYDNHSTQHDILVNDEDAVYTQFDNNYNYEFIKVNGAYYFYEVSDLDNYASEL